MLDAADVKMAIESLTGQPVEAAEAEQLAKLLGSREEFLAWLVLKRQALSSHPAILDAFRRAAAKHGAEARSTRPSNGGFQEISSAQHAFRHALETLVAASSNGDHTEAERAGQRSAAADRLSALFKEKPRSSDGRR